ncbi:MAG TPA: MMPL family transporter [Solirubrobacteraceae bacterium]|nr:MMPL family transporter [Solirubrobacteraceae bacterium]
MTTITRWVLAHRRLVAGAWVVVTLAGIATVGNAVNSFSKTFSVPGREGFVTNTRILRAFHSGGKYAPLLAVTTLPPDTPVSSPAVRAGLANVAARLRAAVPGSRVESYASTGDRAGFVSTDGRTTFVLAYPPPDNESFGTNTKAAKRATAALTGVTIAGARVDVTGVDALQAQTGGTKGPGVLLESVLGGLGALVVLAFVFASLLAFVPLLMAIVSIMTTFLVLYGVTAITSVSSIVEFLVALIGLGVAIDYSLLVVVRWREERAHGHDGDEAVVRAMATAGRAVVFSGTTVAIGLLAMIVLPLPFLRSIGFAGMLIPLVSVVVAITLLPIVLVKIGGRLDWPHVRTDDTASRSWTAWAQLVVRRRWFAALGAALVLAALVLLATSLQPGTANVNTLSKQGQARTGLVALERSGLGPGPLQPIEVLAPSVQAHQVAAALSAIHGVDGAVAPVGPAFVRDGIAEVDAFPFADGSTGAGRDTITAVKDAAHGVGPRVKVGGIGAENADFVSAIYGSFPVMIALIAVLTFLLLARAFRSLLLPLKAVVLNIVSVAAAWGVITVVWQQGHGSSLLWGIAATHSVTAWIPLMVFAFLFGLSMDYEVFILSRMREEYDASGSTDAAVVTGIGRTGRLVTSAALILFLAFVSMSSTPDTDVKVFATGLAAGILLDATVIRALLVPAVVSLFGRWNWWLPERPARLLRVAPSLPGRPAAADTSSLA